MILWEAVIEEIALEGLDGITLPTLWLRLQSRPGVEFVFDDAGQQWIWTFIRQKIDILSIYQLPVPRPSLNLGGDDDASVDERAMYPVNIITEGDWWGSCSALEARVDITDTISVGHNYASLNTAMETFGPERLVVVASQKRRNLALFGPSCDYETLFRENSISRLHYAMLERIGRSRYAGINAGASDSLHALFKSRAKDIFYVLRRFENWGIIKKQIASTVVNRTKLMTATVATLTRFNTPMDRSKYFAPMRKLVTFLEGKPNKQAPFSEVKELFGIVTVYYVKKILQTFPGVVRTVTTKVEAPNPSPRKRKSPKKKLHNDSAETINIGPVNDQPAIDEGEVSQTSSASTPGGGSKRTVVARYFELIGRMRFEEETEEPPVTKTTSIDDLDSTRDDEEDEENVGGSSGSVEHSIDWSQYNPFRTRVFETLRAIRQSGAQGMDRLTLQQVLGIDRKHMERMIGNLKRGNQFKCVIENDGKRRVTKLVWSNAEHEAEQYFKRFEAITGLDLKQLGEKERMRLGERNVKRMLFILDRAEKIPVANAIDYLRALREWEQDEGYGHILDKKWLRELLTFLSNYRQLNLFITVIKCGNLHKTVEFVCHKGLEFTSPELQSKLCTAKSELSEANARQNATNESKEKGPTPKRSHKKRNAPPPAQEIEVEVAEEQPPKKKGRKKRELNEKQYDDVRRLFETLKKKSRSATSTTSKTWLRTHPAVQKQLQKHRPIDADLGETPSQSSRRKRKADFDDVDRASFAKRRRLRAQFSHKERQMLLLIRAVSYVFYAGSRLWVDACTVRDLMHKYVPESMDKTSKTLLQTSSRELGTNPRAGESMLTMAEQLQKNEKIKKIKKRLARMANGPVEKRWAFEKAFEVARRMFFAASEFDFDDLDLSTVHEKYNLAVDTGQKLVWPIVDVDKEEDILENTAKRVIYSALSISRRDGTYAPQLNMIYKELPDTLLLRVFSRLRRNGMLVMRGPSSSRYKQLDVPRKRSGDLSLSFFYRHFFYHHYHVTLAKEAKTIWDTMKSQSDEWHNVLNEMPGNVIALTAMSANKQLYFDLTVPSNVVAYNDAADQTAPSANAAEEEDDDDWPRIISATSTNLLQSEDDEDGAGDFELDIGPSAAVTAMPQPITIKREEPDHEQGTVAIQLDCHSANKWLLYKLRQERLSAVETSDYRTVTVRVRDLTLNSCLLKAKLAASFKDTTITDLQKARKAVQGLINDASIEPRKKDGEDQPEANGDAEELDTEMETRILAMFDLKGSIGMTAKEFEDEFGDDPDVQRIVKKLIAKKQVFVCGVSYKRYVSKPHIGPWSIRSMRIQKADRAKAQEIDMAESGAEPVNIMPRPWLKPDGTLNKPMLRWLSEGLFLRIVSTPGVTDSYIQEQFSSVMDPVEAYELAEYLIKIGCLVRNQKTLEIRKPQLFGPPIVEKITITSYDVPMDAVIKFATVFEKTPMPDFVSNWLTGAGGSDRSTIFGRRRILPRQIPTGIPTID